MTVMQTRGVELVRQHSFEIVWLNTPLHYLLCQNTTFLAGNGVIVDQVQPINMIGLWCYNQSGMTELLIMRDPHYGRMCFKSVKTLGALHS